MSSIMHNSQEADEIIKALREQLATVTKERDELERQLTGLQNTLRIARESMGLPAESSNGGLDLQEKLEELGECAAPSVVGR